MNIIKKIYIKLFKFILSKLQKNYKTKRLGTDYGGWNLIDFQELNNKTIISAGCGEDISFDIEFLNMYGGKVILVDPTPRAINHLEQVMNSIGNKKTKDYIDGGNQQIESYNLEKVQTKQIIIKNFALYKKDGVTIKFYPPKNPEHVSHSISNWQKGESDSNKSIEVETITVKKLMEEHALDKLELIKLDIEGAENQVLPSLIKNKIYPDQILVEFDELHTDSFISYFKALVIILRLLYKKYVLIKTSKFPDMLFVKKEILKQKVDHE